MEKKTVYI